jgi:hypothetical protein
MPYIKNDEGARDFITGAQLSDVKLFSPGDLNFAIHCLVERYLETNLGLYKSIPYDMYATVKGVLGDVKDEITRRAQGPYEDAKIKENGDISFYSRLKK